MNGARYSERRARRSRGATEHQRAGEGGEAGPRQGRGAKRTPEYAVARMARCQKT